MNKTQLVAFLRAQRWAVEASVNDAGAPQAAVIGVAVTDDLELVFDTVTDTRKARNLRKNPHCALVIGWDDGKTAQLQGVADEPTGDELARLKKAYFAKFPDGIEREAWPDIAYFRVRPTWVRFSDFTADPPAIEVISL